MRYYKVVYLFSSLKYPEVIKILKMEGIEYIIDFMLVFLSLSVVVSFGPTVNTDPT